MRPSPPAPGCVPMLPCVHVLASANGTPSAVSCSHIWLQVQQSILFCSRLHVIVPVLLFHHTAVPAHTTSCHAASHFTCVRSLVLSISTATQQSWHQTRVKTATQTGPAHAAPQWRHTTSGMMLLRRLTFCLWTPTHSRLSPAPTLVLDASTQAPPCNPTSQDASSQFSRSVSPRRRIYSQKRSRAPEPNYNSDGAAAVSQEQREVPPLMCSSRIAVLSGHQAPLGLEELSPGLLSHLIHSKRPPLTHNVSTALA